MLAGIARQVKAATGSVGWWLDILPRFPYNAMRYPNKEPMNMNTNTPSTLRTLTLLMVLGLVLTALLAACGSASQPTPAPGGSTAPAVTSPTIDAASLLDERCSSCHPSSRVKTAQKSQAEWQQTVDRMIAKGAQLSDAEKAALVQYLADTYGP
jgi:cytochrome c5